MRKRPNRAVMWMVIAAITLAIPACSLTAPKADLYASTSRVERWKASTSSPETVPAGQHASLSVNDGVTVDASGSARLDVGGCLVRIFRDSALQVEGLPTESAPACVAKFTAGTIYSQVDKEMIVGTEFAVIRTLGTRFFLHLDAARGLLWVIVAEGRVVVEAAGSTVVVGAGEQTWVWRGQPPEPVRPATRPEAGQLFPVIETLTNGALADTSLLREAVVAPSLSVSVEQSAGQVFSGECGEPRTLQVWANLDGPAELLRQVSGASVSYQWEGIDRQFLTMTRADDRTFTATIDPANYCCGSTVITFQVQVFGARRQVLGGGEGKAELSYCIR